MKRTLIIAIGAFFVASMIGFYGLYKSLDVIIETAIEKYGSEITQAELSLAGVTIDPADGRSALKGLKLGNPAGFSVDYAAQIDEISVMFDVDTFTRDVIVVKEIRITQPIVTYEIGAKGSNFDALQRNIDAYMGAGGSSEKAAKTDAFAGQKLVIDNLYISDGKIIVSAAGLKGKALSAALPNIHLTGIGRKTGGATAGEVAKIIIASLSRGVGKGVAVLKLDDVLGAVGGKTKGVSDIIRKSTGDRLTKDVGKAMEGLFK
ncbi:MAG: hypothetical protein R8K46_04485 [Mariprofundaceae bacterium]